MNYTINEENIEFLKKTDLWSQYLKERLKASVYRMPTDWMP